jgi:hypothetical protein
MEPYDPSQPDEDPGSDMITMNPSRWPRWRPGRPVAIAGVALVALVGGGGIGYAATHSLTARAADTAALAVSSPTASPSPSASGKPGSGHGWRSFPDGPGRVFGPLGLGGGVLHGQLTVPKSGGGYQTVDVQNGTVTAVSTGSVTVKSADGFTATYAVTSKTVVAAESPGIASVKKGDTLFVTATVSGSTATAASIVDVTAVKAGRASFGFPEGATKMMPVPVQPAGS